MSASVIFSAGISLLKRVCKMSKSATGHADAIRFWGHIHAMHCRNSSLHLGNKMVESSNIDSNHETLVHFGHHCSASYICAHIIQRILWYYNGYCDCHWNRIQRILWFNTNTCHWIIQNPGGQNYYLQRIFKILMSIFVSLSIFLYAVCFSTVAEVPVKFQSNQTHISRLQYFTRSYNKTSIRFWNWVLGIFTHLLR